MECTALTWTKWRPNGREEKLKVTPTFPGETVCIYREPSGKSPFLHSTCAPVCLLHIFPISSYTLCQQVSQGPLPSSNLQPHAIAQAHSRCSRKIGGRSGTVSWLGDYPLDSDRAACKSHPATHSWMYNREQLFLFLELYRGLEIQSPLSFFHVSFPPPGEGDPAPERLTEGPTTFLLPLQGKAL